MGCRLKSQVPGWEGQYSCRQVIKANVPIRMVIGRQDISKVRETVGPAYRRSMRVNDFYKIGSVQQLILRPQVRWGGLFGSNRLGRPQQFCKSSILDDSEITKNNKNSKGKCHTGCPLVACSNMVSGSCSNDDRLADFHSKLKPSGSKNTGQARATEKQTLEVICLEDIWAERLNKKGWTVRLQHQLPYCWAKSTLELYNRLVNKLAKFCAEFGSPFPPQHSLVLAEFLCNIADSTHVVHAVSWYLHPLLLHVCMDDLVFPMF